MAASAPTPHATGFPAEGRCGYYVEKKKRFCRMVVAAGKRFCGEHAGAAEEENARKRILCPLDPKHTVYEDQLAKHLKKCNSREKPKPVDGKHRKKNSVFERLQIDIQHLCLNKIPVLSKEKLPVVGIGKHLCGMATGVIGDIMWAKNISRL
uniref:tRNA:m(4)X modification enzyme TRM13 n=1 Tax=Equus caballus TaxID=9796 RepID=A0A9L0RQ34_HORSE